MGCTSYHLISTSLSRIPSRYSLVIRTILFLDEFGDCTKSQLYGFVFRTSSMPRGGLDAMDAAGLIVQTGYRGSNVRVLSLTDLGRDVARRLRDIESVMSPEL